MDAGTPEGNRRTWRKLGVHLVRMHQDISEVRGAILRMIEEHTVNGKPIDIKASYQMLTALVEQGVVRDKKDEKWQRQLAIGQAGVWIFGALAPVTIAVCAYLFIETREQVKENAVVNIEQSKMLERIQTTQLYVVGELKRMRDADKEEVKK